MKKTLKAMVCQICGRYYKTKSEKIKHNQKDHIIFFSFQIINFKTLFEKAKTNLGGWFFRYTETSNKKRCSPTGNKKKEKKKKKKGNF